jgi:hypothetical protein
VEAARLSNTKGAALGYGPQQRPWAEAFEKPDLEIEKS